MNLLQALDDPQLFAPHFKGGSWGAWRAFLAAFLAQPMSEAEQTLYRKHTGRTALPSSPFKEAALICGRRGGKSRVLALIATYLATFRDYGPYLSPGEVATVAVLAADRKQARSIFRYIEGMLDNTPLLAGMVTDRTQESIGIWSEDRPDSRVAIEIHTASFRVTRGYTFAAVLADETAFWRDDSSANPAAEIFRALKPGLATIPGAILLNASSPYRRQGVLWDAFRRHYGKDDAPVLVWKGSTAEMNPAVDPRFIEEAYEDDPESAAAEYGAEFRSDIAAFVSREVVDSCTVPGLHEMPPRQGMTYSAFVDPSGGSADSMTLAIAHSEGERGILDAVREIKPPFSPEAAVSELCALLKTYNIMRVTGDRYAGEWPREQFRKHGVTYECSEKPKSDIYRELLPLLNSGKVDLLDNTRLAGQLCGLERRTARGGRDSIDHGPGAHDDLVNSAAGVLVSVAGQMGHLEKWLRLAGYDLHGNKVENA